MHEPIDCGIPARYLDGAQQRIEQMRDAQDQCADGDPVQASADDPAQSPDDDDHPDGSHDEDTIKNCIYCCHNVLILSIGDATCPCAVQNDFFSVHHLHFPAEIKHTICPP